MTPPAQAVLVFARAPEPGRAKTRLIPALGERGAAELHAGLVERALQTACAPGVGVQLWCHPDSAHPFFAACAERFPVSLHEQGGDDLGARMAHALATALRDHRHALLVGSDCPDLSPRDLADGLAALAAGVDVVLGPATDGGYYLVGMSRPRPGLFEDMGWGGDRVLSQTLARLRQWGLTHHLLTPHADIDTPADLAGFADRCVVMDRGKRLVELDR